MLQREQQRCLWVNRQGESDNSSNKHQSAVVSSAGGSETGASVDWRWRNEILHSSPLFLCMSLNSLSRSLARSHVLDFFYRRKLNERKKKVFPPPLLHFCSILPTFWLPKLADGAKSYRNKPGTLFFPVRQKTPLCAFITFCSLQASYKHTILCTAEDTSHISSVCQADLYKAGRSQTFDSSLDRMMSPKMSH